MISVDLHCINTIMIQGLRGIGKLCWRNCENNRYAYALYACILGTISIILRILGHTIHYFCQVITLKGIQHHWSGHLNVQSTSYNMHICTDVRPVVFLEYSISKIFVGHGAGETVLDAWLYFYACACQ